MNYYDETILNIDSLIEKKDYDKALSLVINELEMPYIPKEYENIFLQKFDEIKSYKKVFPEFDDEKMLDYLHGNSFKQLNAINYLSKKNLNDYILEIEEYLLGEYDDDVKKHLILFLIQQKVNHLFKCKIGQEDFLFNPIFLHNIEDDFVFKSIFYMLSKLFENDNPIFFKHATNVLFLLFVKKLPLYYTNNEIKNIYHSIVIFIFDAFNLAEEKSFFISENNIFLDKLINLENIVK